MRAIGLLLGGLVLAVVFVALLWLGTRDGD